MSDGKRPGVDIGRREFLGGVGVGVAGAAVAAGAQIAQAPPAAAQSPTGPAPTQIAGQSMAAPPAPAGYTFLKPAEAQFIEALVDHMVPKDELTASGTDLGIATYIDRQLAGSWGKGDRLYMGGPWERGTPNQGYQLPLTPAELYRAGIAACDAHCRKAHGKVFANLAPEQKEAFLKDLQGGKITFPGGLPGRVLFGVIYENVMEGMFADPIYGGNKDKAAWAMIGFPGVMANNAENARKYADGQRFPAKPVSIADMS